MTHSDPATHATLTAVDLPARWAGAARHVILETGFGPGHPFLATWAAWRADLQRCELLLYIAIGSRLLTPAELTDSHRLRGDATDSLAEQLRAAWPLATPDLHLIDFEAGRVQLMLAFGDIDAVWSRLHAAIDTVYLNGFASAVDPAMGRDDVFKRLARLAHPSTRVAIGGVTDAMRPGLTRHGFVLTPAPSFNADTANPGDVGNTGHVMPFTYAPRYRAAAPRGEAWPHAAARHALVIGGGLAGCATAHALARQGWHSTLIDRHAAPAQEASGNAGGLMHGIFNAPDSPHARWFRAAALATHRLVADALHDGLIPGALDGFLRLDERLDAARARAQLDAVGLPTNWLDWCDATAARDAAGIAMPCGAWRYGPAGWLDPAAYCRWLLSTAGAAATWIGGVEVAALLPPDDHSPDWRAIDIHGTPIASAPVVVLANALDAQRLQPAGCVPLPLKAVRGQVTRLAADTLGLHPPRLPVAGQGYALTLAGGDVLVGATTQDEPISAAAVALRAADQRHNLQRAVGLGALGTKGTLDPALDDDQMLPGRVGWRAVTPDRLPLVGPPVDGAALAALRADRRNRLDALRHLPRHVTPTSGLYLCTGLGSRGITSAALAGRLVAAWISGAPCPVDTDLRDALDPARLAT